MADSELINVLIVDDEPKNLTVLETVLDDPGYRFVRAGSGDEALLALVRAEFALVILDIQMPGMTGFELAQMIRQRKKTATLPIIFLTAYYNEDQHIIEGYDTGAVDFLHKPVNPRILKSKVAVFADLYRTSRSLRELNETLERRVAERTAALQLADRRKDEFLATLAHELRNPLAPIRNAMQVLHLKAPAAEEWVWAEDVINRQMRAMTRLIDDLMDVSRISRGKVELRLEPLELADVVCEAVEASRPLIEAAGHTLQTTVPPEGVWVRGDRTRLVQVLLNLLNNAAKFTPAGGHVALTAGIVGDQVTVGVRDSGIGVPPTHREAIFEMFAQVEPVLTREYSGLGIGLSLARQFVTLHGGELTYAGNEPDPGSEFTVRLPLGHIAPSTASTVPSDEATPLPIKILVVDDNRDAATSMALVLQAAGGQIRTANSGVEALQIAEEFHPKVVVLDIGMPKMSGHDVAQSLRRWPDPPLLIAVTGWGQPEDFARSHAAGFDCHLVKPVDLHELNRIIAEWTHRRQTAMN